ncbi:MAG: ribosomal protein S18-alanine N-acetyltransferase [Phormidesmis sp.]
MPFIACLPLIEADLSAVLALDQQCLGGLWTRSGYQRELESECSDLLVLMAARSAELLQPRLAAARALSAPSVAALEASASQIVGVGCLWAILEEAHIVTLAIEPSYQGQKLGQLLLTQLLLCGHRRGLTRATLEVRASNQKALKLYEKFGFKAAGIRKRYYADGENACILWRSGLQHGDTLTQLSQYQEGAIAQLAADNQYIFLPGLT